MNLSRQHHPSSPAHSTPRAWLLSLGLFGAALGMAEPARAQQACDLDCPLGTTCELAPLACPAIACAEDNPDCPRCDPTPVTPYCALAACNTDSDCSDDNACTLDKCNVATGKCDKPAEIEGCCKTDADCNDNDPCTTDQCSGPGGKCR